MRQRLIWLVVAVAAVMPAFGGTVSVDLGSASSFALLGGSISNTGTSYIVGNVGIGDPAGTITDAGGPGGSWVVTGTVYPAKDPTGVAAYGAFESAFNAALLLPTISPYDLNLCPTGGDLTGNCTFFGNNAYELPLTNISTTTGTVLTFDGQNNPADVFVIRIAGAFTVNGVLTFDLIKGAQANKIFWIVGTDATISVGSSPAQTFDGSILAGDAFTMSAASRTGGSGVLAGTIDGCVFSENTNTLAGETEVDGCSGGAGGAGGGTGGGGSVPEPGTLTLLSMGLGAGCLLRRKFRSVR